MTDRGFPELAATIAHLCALGRGPVHA